MDETAKPLDGASIARHIQTWLLASTDLGQDILAYAKVSPGEEVERLRAMRPTFTLDLEEFERKRSDFEKVLKESDSRVQKATERFTYKCSLFLVALNKVARWGKELKKVDPDHHELVDRYLVSFASGADVRNIHEHDDEYLTGGGRYRDKLFETIMNGLITIDAVSTITVNGETLIGGRVSVQAMLQAVEVLSADLHTVAARPASAGRQ